MVRRGLGAARPAVSSYKSEKAPQGPGRPSTKAQAFLQRDTPRCLNVPQPTAGWKRVHASPPPRLLRWRHFLQMKRSLEPSLPVPATGGTGEGGGGAGYKWRKYREISQGTKRFCAAHLPRKFEGEGLGFLLACFKLTYILYFTLRKCAAVSSVSSIWNLGYANTPDFTFRM